MKKKLHSTGQGFDNLVWSITIPAHVISFSLKAYSVLEIHSSLRFM